MAFTPGFYIPDDVPPAPGGDGDTIDIDPAALDELKAELQRAAQHLETERFSDIHLDAGAFGGSPTGVELGAEHRTAHQIISDTIRGVVTDLWGYREGVEQFEAGMGNADDAAAVDFQARQAAVDALVVSAGSNNAENQYHDSRVNHLPPDSGTGPATTGPGTDAGADAPGQGGEG